MTRIIAIASEKGGVAKTTTANSLGGALVEMGQEVLMVDMDPQASLTLSLGIAPHKVHRSISDVLINLVPPVSVRRRAKITSHFETAELIGVWFDSVVPGRQEIVWMKI